MNFQLETLKTRMLNCQSCDLCKTRTQVVFDNGVTTAKIMVVGEAPGEEEDLTGQPFVGKSGQKLDSILKFVGLSRDQVYITNSVLCRPQSNRVPRGEELDACRWRLNLQIDILKPELIIALGKTATQQLRGEIIKGSLSQLFPENVKDGWLHYSTGKHTAKVLVSYHPSYILRTPEKAYKAVLPHWQQVKSWIKNN